MPVSQLHAPTLRTLAFARATRPSTLRAVTVADEPGGDRGAASASGCERDVPVPLTVLESPYRDVTGPLLTTCVRAARLARATWCRSSSRSTSCGTGGSTLLHNQSALRLKARLLFRPGVMVTSVPWQLGAEVGDDTVGGTPHDDPWTCHRGVMTQAVGAGRALPGRPAGMSTARRGAGAALVVVGLPAPDRWPWSPPTG